VLMTKAALESVRSAAKKSVGGDEAAPAKAKSKAPAKAKAPAAK
jgi:hypothetical protein